MKKLILLLTLSFTAFSLGCKEQRILFKPPAQLDPMPKKYLGSSGSTPVPETSDIAWNLKKVGFADQKTLKSVEYQGSPKVKVALLSTGIDYNNPCLQGQFIINHAEITNSIDINPSVDYKDSEEDADDLVDNIIGYDLVDNDGLAYDRHGAGTAVASIIAGQKGPQCEVQGLVNKVNLYPIRYINDNGQTNIAHLSKALGLAHAVQADIVFVQTFDIALGGLSGRQEVAAVEAKMLKQELEKLKKNNVPVVIGAGESDKDFLQTATGKLVTQYSNVLVVTSTTEKDNLAALANYSRSHVLTAAPGHKIKVAYPKGKYEVVRGTAYAAAHVVGALVMAEVRFGERMNVYKHVVPSLVDIEASTYSPALERWVRSASLLHIPKFLDAIEKRINH